MGLVAGNTDVASGGSREPEPRISLHQGLRDLRLCRVSGTEAHSILRIEAWCGRKGRGQVTHRDTPEAAKLRDTASCRLRAFKNF